jgi:hypothetical protein
MDRSGSNWQAGSGQNGARQCPLSAKNGHWASMYVLNIKADIPAQKEKGPAQWPVPPIARTSPW